jgi:small-conductance mechanosensitive channel
MKKYISCFLTIALIAVFIQPASAVEPSPSETKQEKPTITISEDMDEVIAKEASRVKEDLKQQARSLFERQPLGWNFETIGYLSKWIFSLPQQLPEFSQQLVVHSRALGAVGSILIFVFLAAIVYSLLGRKRVLALVEKRVKTLSEKLPEKVYPYFQALIRVIVTPLIPLILLGAFSLISALIYYRASWFLFTGRVLWLWVLSALIIAVLRELLTRDLFDSIKEYGSVVFQITRLIILSVFVGLAVYWGAQAFALRADVLAFLRFGISITVIFITFLLVLKKKAFLSLIPELPYTVYNRFTNWLEKYYYPLIIFSLLTALLWSVGYKQLGRVVLLKIWSTALAFVLIMVLYHLLKGLLQRWSAKTVSSDEAAQYLIRALKTILTYATVLATLIIALNLLGLLNPLARILSFPVLQMGDTRITFWIIIRAVLILLGFVFGSRLMQAYLDYQVYPTLGIDTGLGYALNTFFKYLLIAIGFLIALNIVGIDLRIFLVFAGAIGIGIGLGLQSMAANVIAGFTIIFGGKIRKGDWIEVHGTLGMVTDIYMRAAKVRTRDNIEYLVPNSDLISNIIVNYSLSSPNVRIELPVGVSYDADPKEVERILMDVAEKEPLLSKYKKPAVRFVEYGDNSINFELLVWIDIQKQPRRKVRSALYFAIFEELKKAGIEIPFPQRDIHIRSSQVQGDSQTKVPLSARA